MYSTHARVPETIANGCTVETALPLVVSPRTACRMLSVGMTHLYQLIAAGELRSYRDGRMRRISAQSIRDYVVRRLTPVA